MPKLSRLQGPELAPIKKIEPTPGADVEQRVEREFMEREATFRITIGRLVQENADMRQRIADLELQHHIDTVLKPFEIKTAFVNKILGNDATGRIGDPERPFMTFEAAAKAERDAEEQP